MAAGCAPRGKGATHGKGTTHDRGTTDAAEMRRDRSAVHFALPSVPAAISDPQQRAEYVREHFWDGIDFTDSLTVELLDTAEMTEAFALYAASFATPDDNSAVAEMINKVSSSKRGLSYVSMLAERVLYDPNSPMRCDELYIPVLEARASSSSLDPHERLAAEQLLELARRNRPHHRAEDFVYTLRNGRRGTLHTLQADYTLLFFHNPGCPMCRTLTEQIKSSPRLSRLIADGRLKVLAVYPDDDLSEWNAHGSLIPSSWLDARDADGAISDRALYDLKAIPSLYLLDGDKRVLVKDSTDAAYIESVLAALGSE